MLTRCGVVSTTALIVCTVSSVSGYTTTPFLRSGHHGGRLEPVHRRAARPVVATSARMVYTPARIDESDPVAVENMKRNLDRLVEMPSAAPNDQVVCSPPFISLLHFSCCILSVSTVARASIP
jgi:hypothetical protein